MNGEAADEVVRMVVNGSEVAIRLTGSAAKNLAAILVAWSKNHKKVYGKTSMMKLLRSGEELQVLSMTKEQYLDFKASARKQVLFAPFMDKKSEDGKVDVVIAARSIPLVNHILDRIGYIHVEPDKEEPPKKILRRGEAQAVPGNSPKPGSPTEAVRRRNSITTKNLLCLPSWRRTRGWWNSGNRRHPLLFVERRRPRKIRDDRRCAVEVL